MSQRSDQQTVRDWTAPRRAEGATEEDLKHPLMTTGSPSTSGRVRGNLDKAAKRKAIVGQPQKLAGVASYTGAPGEEFDSSDHPYGRTPEPPSDSDMEDAGPSGFEALANEPQENNDLRFFLTNEFNAMKAVLASDFLKLADEVRGLRKEVDLLAARPVKNGCEGCALCEAGPTSVSVDSSRVSEKIDSVLSQIEAQNAAREQAKKARADKEAKEAEQKKIRLESAAKALEEAKAKRAEKKQRQKEARAARVARQKEVREKKARGEDPYTPQETEAYKARLEKKGKTFYTADERAAYKATLDKTKAVKKTGSSGKGKVGKTFKAYSDEQKAAFIKANFTDKGRTYYTKEQRRAYQLGKKASA